MPQDCDKGLIRLLSGKARSSGAGRKGGFLAWEEDYQTCRQIPSIFGGRMRATSYACPGGRKAISGDRK